MDIYIENNGVYLTSCGSRRKYGYYRKKIICKSITGRGRRYHFGYPGGMVTDLFDELYKQDAIEVVLPRHEQGLLHEAEGYAKQPEKSVSVL